MNIETFLSLIRNIKGLYPIKKIAPVESAAIVCKVVAPTRSGGDRLGVCSSGKAASAMQKRAQ